MIKQPIDVKFETVIRLNSIKLRKIISLNGWFTDSKALADFLYRINNVIYCSDTDIIALAYEVAVNSDSPLYNLDDSEDFCRFVQSIAFQINRDACNIFYRISSIE